MATATTWLARVFAGGILGGTLLLGATALASVLAVRAWESFGAAPTPQVHDAPALADLAPHATPGTIDDGWAALERGDAYRADQVFTALVTADPSDLEAHYVLGYARLQRGELASAREHLCAASASADLDTAREVDGLLRSRRIGCPD
jgi:Flp pilus assembly protein TadD